MSPLAVCILALLVVLIAAETTSASLPLSNKYISNGRKKDPERYPKSLRGRSNASCRYAGEGKGDQDQVYRIIANRVPLEKRNEVCKTFEDYLQGGKCGYIQDKANLKCGYGGGRTLDIEFNAQDCDHKVVEEAWRLATENTYGGTVCRRAAFQNEMEHGLSPGNATDRIFGQNDSVDSTLWT
ncbi:hypothetical protein CcaCcLH18_11166 [Colletotrichum camelliae]|nr:hypothetical protein CcaCcLH18_11166 [Colletotrichum camelliae]